MVEILAERPDGFRAIVDVDEWPHRPDGDWFGVMFSADGWTGHADVLGSCYRAHGTELADVLRRAWRHYGSWHMVGRYVRAWHDVAGFDYADRGDGTLVNIVTRECLAECWGWQDVAAYAAQTGSEDVTAGGMAEWLAWADGDVYWYRVERANHYVNREDPADTVTMWETVWSVGGFYGDAGYTAACEDARAELEAQPPRGESAGGAA